MVPPHAATSVQLQLEIFKVVSVDLKVGRMSLKLWVRTRFKDPRLAWDPAAFDGVTEIRAYPAADKASVGSQIDNNMWMPDLHWYNSLEAAHLTSELGAAKVSSDGSVLHSAPGRLEISCRFTNLVNFPRGEISCPFDVGSWAYSDAVVNLSFFETGGAQTQKNQETSGTSYQEYGLTRLETSRVTTSYPGWGDYSNLLFRIYMKRPETYYIFTVEYPSILLTIVSMLVFWLDATACGERLGVSFTMLLAVQVLKIVTSDVLPVCGEVLWIELLLVANELFCVLSLLCSVWAFWTAYKGLGTVDEKASERYDYWARRIVPPAYVVVMSVIYGLDLDDAYKETTNPMYEGLGKLSVRATVAIVPLLLAGLAGTMLLARRQRSNCQIKQKDKILRTREHPTTPHDNRVGPAIGDHAIKQKDVDGAREEAQPNGSVQFHA